MSTPTNNNRRVSPVRRGSIYLLVLMACMVVTVAGMTAILASQVERRALDDDYDIEQARLCAQAGVEMALYWIGHDSNWRSNGNSQGTEKPMSKGTYSFTLTDPVDGNLTNSIYDPVLITGIGRCAKACQKVGIRLNVEKPGYACLNSSIHAGRDVTIKGSTLTADQWVTANGKVNAQSDGGNNSVVNADVAAYGGVTKDSSSVYNMQTSVDGTWPIAMPSTTTVLNYYTTNGTVINAANLPRWDAELLVDPGMEGTLQSPPTTSWAPYGSCTIAKTTTCKKVGNSALLVTNRPAVSSGPSQDLTDRIASGLTYSVSIYAYLVNYADNARVTLKIQAAGSPAVSYSTSWVAAAMAKWVSLTGELTPTWTGELSSAVLFVETQSTTSSFVIDATVNTSGQGAAFYEKPTKSEFGQLRVIHRKLLSPQSNPFGTGVTNAEGIYVLDLSAVSPAIVSIQRSRILGTLVVLNGDAYIWGVVRWSPAVSIYPALLSNKGIHFWLGIQGPTKNEVIESECNVNFNPTGTPYNGLTNSTKTDTYTALMRGIVYTTGDIDLQYHPVLEGVLLAAGNITSTATDVNPITLIGGRTYVDFTYLRRYFEDAPPGFCAGPVLKIAPGSFRQTVD